MYPSFFQLVENMTCYCHILFDIVVIGDGKVDSQILLQNIEKIHTTDMGVDRIKKNLKIKEDPLEFCKKIIKVSSMIYKKGKNYYVEYGDIRITINSYTYTIITAHRIKKGNEYGV